MQINLLSKGRSPMRTVLMLSWPAMLEQLLLSLAGYIDTAMVGSVGVVATAAVAVNASTTWLINGFLISVATGFTFLVARHTGAQEYASARDSARHAAVSAVIVGGALTAVVQVIAGYLPHWLGASPEVAPHAAMYLRIVGGGLIFQSCAVVFSSILRGAGDMKTPMMVNFLGNMVNIVCNALLIFPSRNIPLALPSGMTVRFFMPGADLGVAGAAIGTAASYLFSGGMLFICLFRTDTPIRLRRGERMRFNKELIRNALRIAVPTALERSCLCFGQIALTGMIARLGTVQIAAHNLAITAESISYLAADGLAKSATTLVGQSLGAGRKDDAQRFGRLVYRMSFVMMALGGVFLFVCAEPLMRIFTPDPFVIAEGRAVLRIVAAAEPFFGLAIVISGVLYGAGDSRYAFFISAIGMWGIRLGLAWVLAYPCGLGLSGAWIAMSIDLVVRGTLFLLRFRGGKWKDVWRH